jgi:hypothetical protein
MYSQEIIGALKELIINALQEGFGKTSYLVRDHIKYIKKIQSANDPEICIKFTARKLFPTDEAYYDKIEKISAKYQDRGSLVYKFEKVYSLYYKISKDQLEMRKISSEEAEDILDELLE